MLNDYKDEFRGTLQDVESLLEQASIGSNFPVELDHRLQELKASLTAVEREYRSLPSAERHAHESDMREFRDKYCAVQRSCLLSSERNGRLPAGDRSVQELERLERSTAQLESTRRLAEETAAVGEDALCHLYMQRESIQRTMRHAQQAESSLDDSSKTLKKLSSWWSIFSK